MLGDDVHDQTRPSIKWKTAITLPLTVVLEEITTLLPILEDTVDQFFPHPPINLSNALIVPVVQPAGSEDHIVDGKPDRPSPIIVQSAILAIPQREWPDASLGKQLLGITHDGDQLGQDCLDGLAFLWGVEFFPEYAGEEGEEVDVAYPSHQFIHVLVFGSDWLVLEEQVHWI